MQDIDKEGKGNLKEFIKIRCWFWNALLSWWINELQGIVCLSHHLSDGTEEFSACLLWYMAFMTKVSVIIPVPHFTNCPVSSASVILMFLVLCHSAVIIKTCHHFLLLVLEIQTQILLFSRQVLHWAISSTSSQLHQVHFCTCLT